MAKRNNATINNAAQKGEKEMSKATNTMAAGKTANVTDNDLLAMLEVIEKLICTEDEHGNLVDYRFIEVGTQYLVTLTDVSFGKSRFTKKDTKEVVEYDAFKFKVMTDDNSMLCFSIAAMNREGKLNNNMVRFLKYALGIQNVTKVTAKSIVAMAGKEKGLRMGMSCIDNPDKKNPDKKYKTYNFSSKYSNVTINK